MPEDNPSKNSDTTKPWKTADPDLLTVLEETLAPGLIKSAFYVGEGRWPVLKALKAHLGSNYSCTICEWITLVLDEGYSFEDDPDYDGVLPGSNVVYEGVEPAELLIIEAEHTPSSVDRLIKRMSAASPLKAVIVIGNNQTPPADTSFCWERRRGVLVGHTTDQASSS